MVLGNGVVGIARERSAEIGAVTQNTESGLVTNKDQRVVLIHLGKARMGNDGGVSYG